MNLGEVHRIGCKLSPSIKANLVKGMLMKEAVEESQKFLPAKFETPKS